MATPQEQSAEPITAWDRCDRCGAHAERRVQLLAGPLYFCLGHYRRHADALALVVSVPRRL